MSLHYLGLLSSKEENTHWSQDTISIMHSQAQVHSWKGHFCKGVKQALLDLVLVFVRKFGNLAKPNKHNQKLHGACTMHTAVTIKDAATHKGHSVVQPPQTTTCSVCYVDETDKKHRGWLKGEVGITASQCIKHPLPPPHSHVVAMNRFHSNYFWFLAHQITALRLPIVATSFPSRCSTGRKGRGIAIVPTRKKVVFWPALASTPNDCLAARHQTQSHSSSTTQD